MANHENSIGSLEHTEDVLSSDLTNFIMQHYKKILVLERNPAIAEAAKKLFDSEGYNVTVVTEKARAIDMIVKDRPDIMLITEGVSADALVIQEDINKLNVKIEIRLIKDFGSAILGAQEGSKYPEMRKAFQRAMGLIMSLMEFPNLYQLNHASKVADYCEQIARKLELDEDSIDTVVYAAYYHELPDLFGRFLENAERLPADNLLKNTTTLSLDSFLEILPKELNPRPILEHIQERFDGKGYPDRLVGEAIPIGSRIIAMVDIFMQMIQGGPGRKSLKRINAMEQLQDEAGLAFDPKLVSIFLSILRMEMSSTVSQETGEEILILDNTPDDDLLKLKLREAGYKIVSIENSLAALKYINENLPDLIITEVSLPELDGFQLVNALKDDRKTRAIPVVFHSEYGDATFITKGLRLGAEDFLVKPTNIEVAFLKIKKLLSRSQQSAALTISERRGVSGSLLEMSLLDIIQILASGSKTGLIVLKRGQEEGRIYLQDGQIIHVIHNDVEGEEAFYNLLFWKDGDFVLHPDVNPPSKNIYTTNDMLLLKGFQIVDEARRQFRHDA